MSGDHNKYHGTAEVVGYGLKRKREADFKIGAWLSAALEDSSTCQSMKDDINEWFECTPKMEARKREWVGLTLKEVAEIIATSLNSPYFIAVDVEAKLKEKNT